MSVPAPAFVCVLLAATGLLLALLWCSRSEPMRRARMRKIVFGVTTVLLLFAPFGGVPLWNRAFSFYASPSLPMLGIVSAALWQRLFGIAVFTRADWRTLWIFGAVAGTVLYLHPMVFGALDLYYWGWERERATWILAAFAVALLCAGRRLGVLLLAALVAFTVHALESGNCWDYVVDPFYWLIGLGVGARAVFRRATAVLRARARAPETAPAGAGVPVPVVSHDR